MTDSMAPSELPAASGSPAISDPPTSEELSEQAAGPASFAMTESWLTGRAWLDKLVAGLGEGRVSLGRAVFAPSARFHWHRHQHGQLLHVTSGVMILKQEGQPAVALKAGESFACPVDEWHWHGADPVHVLTHLSVIEDVGEPPGTYWGEAIGDEEYRLAVAEAFEGRLPGE